MTEELSKGFTGIEINGVRFSNIQEMLIYMNKQRNEIILLEKENAELNKKLFKAEEEYDKAFKDGAEFGYNKANKWHYVKDGDLPKENEYIMIYSKLADNIAVGKRRCAGKNRKRCVYEWYFATYEGTYCLKDKDVIAWKEIELPKELENV